MTTASPSPDERRSWTLAGGLALAGHLCLAAVVLAAAREPVPPVPETIVTLELPPLGSEAGQPAAMPAEQPQPQPQVARIAPPPSTPPIDVPPARTPPPRDAVTLPPPAPVLQPARMAAPTQNAPVAAAAAPAALAPALRAPPGTAEGVAGGTDPRAKRAEVDYFALIKAHLNRRKTYPVEAKKAREEGVVTVRFTITRDGSVSNISLRRSSGHDLLDAATLQLLQRVAPLPKMPASMARESVTLSLPIDYSLRTI